MKNFIVVNKLTQWPEPIPGAEIVDAQAYLTDPAYTSPGPVRIYNLCDSYCYQRMGYYVSLLAEARGHKPIPRARTMEDLQSPNLVRLLTETLEELVQHAFRDDSPESVERDFYFGLRPGHTEDVLGQQLFQLLKAPLLRAQFERGGDRWKIRNARAIAMDELTPDSVTAVVAAATQHFAGRGSRGSK